MTSLPEHRVALANGWSFWRSFKLRSAGFPARLVFELEHPPVVAAAELAIQLRQDYEREVAAAIQRLDNALAGKTGAARRPITKAIKTLRRGELPADLAETAHELERARGARASYDRATAGLVQAYDAAQHHELAALERIARDPRFREAVVWQNRGSVKTALDLLAPAPGQPLSRKQRKHHHLVASYLQRYCVKNDSAGFFGPGVWGRIDPATEHVAIRPGPGLLAARRLYFEYWGIAALARHIADDDELRPHLVPRRRPTIRIEGTTLHYPVERSTELPVEFATILRAIDGERTAREIADAVIADPTNEAVDPDDVYASIAELEHRELVTWTLEIPTAAPRPEAELRAQLARAGDAGLPGLAVLDELEAKRDAVARATGDPHALDRALGELEDTFEQLTSQRATRAHGQMYAGRMLVFENCQRDLELVVGSDLLRRLAPTLVPLLRSARWYSHAIATRYREVLGEAYRELVRETGSPTIDFLRFWERVSVHFPGGREPAPIVRDARARLQQRWQQVLAAPPPGTREFDAAIEAAFGEATGPGWPSARYHSVDVMLAARGPDAIRRGEYAICLGEVHAGIDNTANPNNRDQHPDPDSLIRARAIDLPDPSVFAVRAIDQAKFGGQLALCPHDFDLELGTARSWRPRSHVLAVGSLVLESRGEQLVARERDGERAFDLLVLMQDYILAEEEAAGGLALFPPNPSSTSHTYLGEIAIQRAVWRFAPEQLGFTGVERGPEQFVAVRGWAQAHQMPRWVFVRTPEEVKPVFIDLDIPLYVELFCKLARAASRMTVSAMFPSFDDTWLPDAGGNLYTSELRILAVDPVAWSA